MRLAGLVRVFEAKDFGVQGLTGKSMGASAGSVPRYAGLYVRSPINGSPAWAAWTRI